MSIPHTESSPAADTALLDSVGRWRTRLSLRWTHLFSACAVSAVFMYFNFMPLFHTDLWGHVAYGEWMLEHGELPQEDPILQNADGVPVIASAWLSQVIMAAVENAGGPEGLSNMYAVVMMSTLIVFGIAFYIQAGRWDIAWLAVVLVTIFGSTRIAVVRTENFGALSFAVLLLVLALADKVRCVAEMTTSSARPGRFWWAYLAVFGTFVFWANAHGSFVVGLAILGCFLAGRTIEALFSRRSLWGVWEDVWVRRYLALLELAIVASLVNPYGMDLLINALTFPGNPNLRDITEWYGISSGDFEGLFFAISCVIMLFLVRLSDRRIPVASVLLLGLFAFQTITKVRMISWYAGVWGYTMVPHMVAVTERFQRFWEKETAHYFPKSNETADTPRWQQPSTVYTAACLLVLWYGFAFSPISSPLFGGKPRPDDKLYSAETPLGAAKFLRENPPELPIFNPQWWGDYLAWAGPENHHVFMTTNAVHVVPPDVWKNYLRIARGQTGWQRIAERYNIATFVIDKKAQAALRRGMTQLPKGWELVYDDDLAAIVSRDPALKAAAKTTRPTAATAHSQHDAASLETASEVDVDAHIEADKASSSDSDTKPGANRDATQSLDAN